MYVKVQFVLTEDLHRRLRQAARQRGVSMSQFAREALERALAEDEAQFLARRRQVVARLREISEALEREGFQPLEGEDVVEMIRQMREERANDLMRNMLGS